MREVTVRCGCGRDMHQLGTATRGTFICGCGARVVVTVARPRPHCCDPAGDCRGGISRDAAALGLPLCAEHFAAACTGIEDWARRRLSGDIARLELIAARREAAVAQSNAALVPSQVRHAIRAERAARDALASWHVYYIRLGDQIKIGTTGDIRHRMGLLAPDEILAIEPGAYAMERHRHRQFAHLRLAKRGERFTPAPELLAHIERTRERWGAPSLKRLPPGARLPSNPSLAISRSEPVILGGSA